MSKKIMILQNWLCVFTGFFLMIIGYFSAYGVRVEFHSFHAFFSVFLINIGLFSIIFGLSFSFKTKIKRDL